MLVLATILGSLMPAAYVPESGISDKWSHVLTYAVLTVWFAGVYRRPAAPRLGLYLFLLGAALEAVQSLTESRSPEAADLAANLAGIVGGAALARAGLDRWCVMVEDWLGAGR